MPSPRQFLPARGFELVFPFHLALDSRLRVSQFGEALGRVLPELREGDELTTHFEVARPRGRAPSFAVLRQHADSVVLFKALSLPMVLRGQLVFVEDGPTAFFLGSPWVTTSEQLDALNLSFSDFAIHDPLADMLVLLRTQESSLTQARNLTATLRERGAELERTAHLLEDQLGEIEEQRDIIRELSTPILKIWKQVVVLPLIGALDQQRAEQLIVVALEAVAQDDARNVIIDVTGLANFDSNIASHLLRAANALRLLGARCILVGVSPALAATLVTAGISLDGIATFATLEAGLRFALTPATKRA